MHSFEPHAHGNLAIASHPEAFLLRRHVVLNLQLACCKYMQLCNKSEEEDFADELMRDHKDEKEKDELNYQTTSS